MERIGHVLALITIIVALLPHGAHAAEASRDSFVSATVEVEDGDEDDRTFFVEEGTFDDPAEDEQPGEALDESSGGLEGLEVAGKRHKKRHRTEPVELGRRRAPLIPSGRYLLMPMGSGFYCAIPEEEQVYLKEWTQQDHNACTFVVGAAAGAGAALFMWYSTGGLVGLAPGGVNATLIIANAFGTAVGSIFGDGVCPGPENRPSSEPPIGCVTPRPWEIGCGLPCLCPDPGCGCGTSCGCGCGNGASCGCGCSDGGGV